MELISGGGLDGLPPQADLRWRGGRPQPAIVAKVAVDIVGFAKFADLGDVVGARLGQANCLFLAADFLERQQLGPPRKHEAAISTAGAGAAIVLLDDHHLDGRILLLEANRRPQPRIAAADDAHIDARIALQRRRLRVVVLEGLAKPLATACHPAKGHGASFPPPTSGIDAILYSIMLGVTSLDRIRVVCFMMAWAGHMPSVGNRSTSVLS